MEKLNRGFQNLAVVCLRTAILFVVVNVILGYAFTFKDKGAAQAVAAASKKEGMPKPGPNRDAYQLAAVDMLAYQGVSESDVYQALDDTTRMGRSGYLYQPWVEVAPPPFNSPSVNVDALDGNTEFVYRRTVEPAAEGQALEVWTFGGSTMFGYNCADQWTVATYLAAALQKKTHTPVHVTNFGRPMYYTSQEMLLFERLLRAGKRPAVAVFLDGLNDTFQMQMADDHPALTPTLQKIMESEQIGKRGTGLRDYQWIPLVKLAYVIRNAHSAQMSAVTASQGGPPPADRAAEFVTRRYLENVDLARYLGKKYGVKTYFFWQPCPMVHYDLSLNRRAFATDPRIVDLYHDTYDIMRRQPDKDVVYFGDLIDEFGKGRKVFVDDVHYNPTFAQFLAQKMAQHVSVDTSTTAQAR